MVIKGWHVVVIWVVCGLKREPIFSKTKIKESSICARKRLTWQPKQIRFQRNQCTPCNKFHGPDNLRLQRHGLDSLIGACEGVGVPTHQRTKRS